MQLYHGDCLQVLPWLDENSVDTCITDPPYGLEFMGKDWDHGIPGVRFWTEVLRVLKPGATLLAFGGTRTHHRLMCAIEDAGFELRDVVMWVYGSGFPKSHDISKAIDKAAGAEREVVGEYSDNGRKCPKHQNTHGDWQGNAMVNITAPATDAAALWDGWGTALKPAWEPVIVAQKPRDGTFATNALTWGVAGLNIDGGRVPGGQDYHELSVTQGSGGTRTSWCVRHAPRHFKPAAGRWPANLIHDGSAEVVGLFPNVKAGVAVRRNVGHSPSRNINYATGSRDSEMRDDVTYNDSGSAARFFYCAKASRSERNAGCEGLEERQTVGGGGLNNTPDDVCGKYGSIKAKARNHHPTVKPLALMRYLCKLTATPTGGVIVDPFCGSGSTGCAAALEGRDFIGIERDADYLEIAKRRIAHWQEQARAEAVALPLFAEIAADD